jgi:hypothetical protein
MVPAYSNYKLVWLDSRRLLLPCSAVAALYKDFGSSSIASTGAAKASILGSAGSSLIPLLQLYMKPELDRAPPIMVSQVDYYIFSNIFQS